MLIDKQRKEFPLQKDYNNNWIFEITKCKCNCAWDLEEWNDIMYIWAKKKDNGFMKMVAYEEKLVTKWNCIIFICDGEWSVGYSNYMDKDFIWSTTLSVWYNEHLNYDIWMFLVTLLDLERIKYSYGRKYGTNLSKTTIRLPVNSEWNPDREFMENYIKTLHSKPITTKNKPWKNVFHTDEWKEFRIGDLFDVQLSKWDIKLDEVDKWNIPLISSWEANNGIVWYISEKWDGKASIFQWNTLTVDMFCNAFYQINSFYAVSHWRVNILSAKCRFNQYIWLFLVTLIRQEQLKYSYGRAVYSNETQNMIIKLPVNSEGNPDREYMENYIKNLPYGDRI